MPGLKARGRPNADEIRAALEHMAASEAFRGSPQLVAFLRYVVEATLRGASDRIKGYTIAVEALGRAENFDPQADPIVRVEAMRLRRALARYYANGGKNDPSDRPAARQLRAGVSPRRAAAAGRCARRRRRCCAGPGAAARRRNGAGADRASGSWPGSLSCWSGPRPMAGLDFWFDFIPSSPAVLATAHSRAPGRRGAIRRPIRWCSSARPSRSAAAPGAGGRHAARQAARRACAFRRDPGRGRIVAGSFVPPARGSEESAGGKPLRPDRERAARIGRPHHDRDPPHRRRQRARRLHAPLRSGATRRRARLRATRRSRTRSRRRWRSPTASSRPMSAARGPAKPSITA